MVGPSAAPGRGPRFGDQIEQVRAIDDQVRHRQHSDRGGERLGECATSRAGPLLCIDEIGYLSYDARNADLLFQVVSRLYERKSLILTTNLAFSDWPTIFPNAACTTALIDRVVHHAEIIAIAQCHSAGYPGHLTAACLTPHTSPNSSAIPVW